MFITNIDPIAILLQQSLPLKRDLIFVWTEKVICTHYIRITLNRNVILKTF